MISLPENGNYFYRHSGPRAGIQRKAGSSSHFGLRAGIQRKAGSEIPNGRVINRFRVKPGMTNMIKPGMTSTITPEMTYMNEIL